MNNNNILRNSIEKVCKKKLANVEKSMLRTLDKGIENAVNSAIKDIKLIHRQYVYRYYKSYPPREYRRTNNLWDISIGGKYKKNGKITGNILIVYSNKNVSYPNPKTNADMVFKSFMEGSRYSNSYVMKQDTDHFGDHVVKFAPKGTRDILRNTQGGRNYGIYADMSSDDGNTLIGKMEKQYREHYYNYVVDYFNDNFRL